MNKIKAMFLALATALAMTLVVASPANAAISNCYPSGGPSAARMSVSSWDSSYYSGSVKIIRKTYHIDLNSSGYWVKNQIAFAPYQNGWQYYSNVEDVYLYHYNDLGTQQIRGRWKHVTEPTEGTYEWRYCYVIN